MTFKEMDGAFDMKNQTEKDVKLSKDHFEFKPSDTEIKIT